MEYFHFSLFTVILNTVTFRFYSSERGKSMNIKIAAVSMEPGIDKRENLKKHVKFIEEAAAQGVNLIVFPEVSVSGFTKEFTVASLHAESSYLYTSGAEAVPEGSSTQFLIEQAKKHNMYICFSLVEKNSIHCEKGYNTAILVGPDGYIGKYRKIHQPGTERLYFFAGDKYEVFDTPIGRIGIMICYDQAFPEAARCLKLLGAEIVICPTGWPVTDGNRSEDDPYLKLYQNFGNNRAFENGFIFVDANQFTGLDRNWPCCGHSRIVDATGVELATTGYEEGMAIAEVDVKDQVKRAFAYGLGIGSSSFMRDLRADVYTPIYENYKN